MLYYFLKRLKFEFHIYHFMVYHVKVEELQGKKCITFYALRLYLIFVIVAVWCMCEHFFVCV